MQAAIYLRLESMNYSGCNLGIYSMSHIEMDKNQTGTKTMTLQTINKPPPLLLDYTVQKTLVLISFILVLLNLCQ